MKNIFVIFIAIAIYTSCQKTIDFNGDSLNKVDDVFIEGILYPDKNPKIYMSSAISFFNPKVTPQETFIRNAEVYIKIANHSYQLYTDSTFDKFRCRWTPFYTSNIKIDYGKTYELDIHWHGNNYHASTTINQPKVNLDRVEYIEEFFDVYGGHDGVTIYFKDPPDPGQNYRFQMNRIMDNSRAHAHILDGLKNDCTQPGELFETTDLGRNIFSDYSNDGENMVFNIEVSFEYKKGDSTTIYLQSLDSSSARFFRELDKQLQSVLNPFVEPSFLHSTIEGGLGVFGSAVRSDPFPFIYPQDNP